MTDPPPPELSPDGPTRMVEGRDGEMVERLSGGTATLLLVWLIGIGAATALLGAWLFAAVLVQQRLTTAQLFSDFGFYVALFGASGPTLLWLTGRAQGHSLGWFVLFAWKIGLSMIGSIILVGTLGALMLGATLGSDTLVGAAALIGLTLAIAVVWALATWGADRYIAKARVREE